jgi:hypothetical protein
MIFTVIEATEGCHTSYSQLHLLKYSACIIILPKASHVSILVYPCRLSSGDMATCVANTVNQHACFWSRGKQ